MAESPISRIPTEVLAEILLELSSNGDSEKLGMDSESHHPRRLKQPLTSVVVVNREWNQAIVHEPRSYKLVLCFRCSASYVYSVDMANSLPDPHVYTEWLEKSDGCDIQVDIRFHTYMTDFGIIRDLVVPYARQLSAFYFQFERAWDHHKELVEILSSLESFPRLRSLCFRWIPDDRNRETATVFDLTNITLDAPVLEKLSLANTTLNWRGTSLNSPLCRLSKLKIEMDVNDPSESLTWSSLLNMLRLSPQLLHLDLELHRIHGPYELVSPKIPLSQLRSCTFTAQFHDLLGLLSPLALPSLQEVTLTRLPNAMDAQLPSYLERLNPDLSAISHFKLTGFDAPCVGQLLSRSKTDTLQRVTHTLMNPSREETTAVPDPNSFPIVSTSLPKLKIDMRDSYNWDGEHRTNTVKQIYDAIMTCPDLLSLTIALPYDFMYDGEPHPDWVATSESSGVADRRYKLLTLRKLAFHGCISGDESYLVFATISMLEAPQLSAIEFDEEASSSSKPPSENLFCSLTLPLLQIQNLSIKMKYAAIALSSVPTTFPNLQELHVHHTKGVPVWRWESLLPRSDFIPLPRLEVMTVIPMNEAEGEAFHKLWINCGHPLKKLGIGSMGVIERWWTSE